MFTIRSVLLVFLAAALVASAASLKLAVAQALPSDEAVRKELVPTGKLRVCVAVAPTPGAGNVAMDASGQPRGISADLGRELAKKLGVTVEWVQYPSSGAVTNAVTSGACDVASLAVNKLRKQKVDFGPPHIVLEATFLVRPGSTIQMLADVDKSGLRLASVEGTGASRAAQRWLKNVKLTNVKDASELIELLRTGEADAITLSRESLTQIATKKVLGSRVLADAFYRSHVAVAISKNKPAALAYASAFVEEMKASGMVRRSLDSLGMQTSVVAPAGAKP